MKAGYLFAGLLLWLVCFSGRPDTDSFAAFRRQFIQGYAALQLPEMEYDYREYFAAIPNAAHLATQHRFFVQQRSLIQQLPKPGAAKDRLDYEHIAYEIDFHLQRLRLEEQWVAGGRKIPQGGLSALPDHEAWYRYFIRKFTSTNTGPEQVLEFGRREVARVLGEMETIRLALGFSSEDDWARHLQSEDFYIKNKEELIERFVKTDSIVRRHLPAFIGSQAIPPVYPMEWPGANAATPPGIYLNRRNTACGKDVFQFNFYNRRYNRRAIEWLYMHEAIPGHHLQAGFRREDPLQRLFLYPGNFEGWACYVEYLGSTLGLLQDAYADYGRLEWDLVRSARLVLDAGIHHLGWTREQALEYWKQTISGQDEIAEREITRVTNWCGQALAYKIGAETIRQMKKDWVNLHAGAPVREFHLYYLNAGQRPLEILRDVTRWQG